MNALSQIAAIADLARPNEMEDDAGRIIDVATAGLRGSPAFGQAHTALLIARGVALHALQPGTSIEDGIAAIRSLSWALGTLPSPAHA